MIIRYNTYSNSLRSRSVIKHSLNTVFVPHQFIIFVIIFVIVCQTVVIMQCCHSLTLFLTPAGIVLQLNSQIKHPICWIQNLQKVPVLYFKMFTEINRSLLKSCMFSCLSWSERVFWVHWIFENRHFAESEKIWVIQTRGRFKSAIGTVKFVDFLQCAMCFYRSCALMYSNSFENIFLLSYVFKEKLIYVTV